MGRGALQHALLIERCAALLPDASERWHIELRAASPQEVHGEIALERLADLEKGIEEQQSSWLG